MSQDDSTADQVAAPAKTGKFQAGRSGNPRGRPKKTARLDGWHSLVSGLGTSYDKTESMRFCVDRIDWDTARNLYAGDDLAARIIDTVPDEMCREGFDLCVKDEAEDGESIKGKDLQEHVENLWIELDLIPSFHEALCFERAYGGSAILIGANDGVTDLAQPLNLRSVRSVDFLTVLEPREISPLWYYGNPRAKKFGQPSVYQLTPITPGASRELNTAVNTQIHESRLIVFPGIRVSRYLEGLNGWGDSILTRVYRVLRNFNVSWGSAGVLIADFAQAVYKMKGLNELLVEDPTDLFKTRMQGMEISRSVARATLIDLEDQFERQQTPVTGLPELLDRFATRLAAAAGLPLPLLMGESPGGLNASGASGDQLRMFYDRVKSWQRKRIIPGMRRITEMLFHATGGTPAQWSIKAKPLWQATEKEQAETRKIQADVDAIYLDRGVLETLEVRESRYGGDAFSYETSLKVDEIADPTTAELSEYETEQTEYDDVEESKLGPRTLPEPTLDPKTGEPITPTGGGREIQKEAMNGPQITSLLEVISAANDKTISRESASAVLRLAFQLGETDAAALLGPENFEPVKPVALPVPGDNAPEPTLNPPAEK